VQGAAGSETSYGDPLEAALAWQSAGAEWLHLVDLDAAFGRGSNAELLAQVVGKLDIKVEMSGGIRDEASLERALSDRVRPGQHRHRRHGEPRLGARSHRRARRQDRDRPRRTRQDPGRPRLDARGR